MSDLMMNVLLGLGAYLGAEMTKLEKWSKYIKLGMAAAVALIVGATGTKEGSTQDLLMVLFASGTFWGVGKATGLNDRLNKVELIGKVTDALIGATTHAASTKKTDE